MDIEGLIIRLEELSKTDAYMEHLYFQDLTLDDNSIFCGDEIDEYKSIESQLKIILIKEIEERSQSIFQNIDLRNFNLKEVERQLDHYAFIHTESRGPIEIKRDKLIGWEYNHYYFHYKKVERFNQLKEIEKERKAEKEKIKEKLINQFVDYFPQELLLKKLKDEFGTLEYYWTHSYYQHDPFIRDKAKIIFEERNEVIKERDTFSYIDLDCYEYCLITALWKSIEMIQAPLKEENVEIYINYLREQIAQGKYDKYVGGIESGDFYNFINDLFENRTSEKIEDDNFRLVNEDAYFEWRYVAIEMIKKEYPLIFRENSSSRDNYDLFHLDDNEDSRIDNSGNKRYGGYNGFNDDAIDDAFEGDPSNTWNVD